jgi:ribosome-binding ATPase YchF (GTP1/OBG family)
VWELFSRHLFSGAESPSTHRLAKIKAWIDANNPGDPLIPFSVSLEERLSALPDEEKADAAKEAGAGSALGKITTAGYASLDVCEPSYELAVCLS